MRIGLNLYPLSTLQPDLKYGDALYASGPNLNGPATPAPAWDPTGMWPTSLGPGQYAAYNICLRGYTRPGTYTLMADGAGKIGLNHMDVPADRRSFVLDGTMNQAFTFDLTHTDGNATFAIGATNPDNPVRNVRLYFPGADRSDTWHPDYLASLRGFSTLRFMDWTGTVQGKASTVVNWADRPDKSPRRSWQAAIDLANRTHVNPWFCLPNPCAWAVPSDGTSDFPAQLGTLLAQTLDPDLTASVEYSDEDWNFAYPWAFEWGYVQDQAKRATPPVSHHEMTARLAHLAFEALAAQVDPAKGPKIRRILGGQWSSSDTAAIGLAAAARNGWHFDAVAPGPYFAPYWVQPNSQAACELVWAAGDTADALAMFFAALYASIPAVMQWGPKWQAISQQYGLPIVAYEFGPALGPLWAGHPAAQSLVRAAVVDPRMAAWCHAMYDAMAAVCAEACYYESGGNAHWGARANLDDNADQRWQSLLQHRDRFNG